MNLVTISTKIDRSVITQGLPYAPIHKLTYEVDHETGRMNLIKIDGRGVGADPFAKPMRKPNAYESIIKDVENVADSSLPAVLLKVVGECQKRGVFPGSKVVDFIASRLLS